MFEIRKMMGKQAHRKVKPKNEQYLNDYVLHVDFIATFHFLAITHTQMAMIRALAAASGTWCATEIAKNEPNQNKCSACAFFFFTNLHNVIVLRTVFVRLQVVAVSCSVARERYLKLNRESIHNNTATTDEPTNRSTGKHKPTKIESQTPQGNLCAKNRW